MRTHLLQLPPSELTKTISQVSACSKTTTRVTNSRRILQALWHGYRLQRRSSCSSAYVPARLQILPAVRTRATTDFCPTGPIDWRDWRHIRSSDTHIARVLPTRLWPDDDVHIARVLSDLPRAKHRQCHGLQFSVLPEYVFLQLFSSIIPIRRANSSRLGEATSQC